jgi:hypothetical protein
MSHSAFAEPEKRQYRRVSKWISDLMAHPLQREESNPFVAHPAGKTTYNVVDIFVNSAAAANQIYWLLANP